MIANTRSNQALPSFIRMKGFLAQRLSGSVHVAFAHPKLLGQVFIPGLGVRCCQYSVLPGTMHRQVAKQVDQKSALELVLDHGHRSFQRKLDRET